MQDFSMEGVSKMNGGEFGKIRVDGVGSCTGDLKAESLTVDGTFKCDGTVDTGLLRCDGAAAFTSNIRAKQIDVNGVINVKSGIRIEAEHIKCDGVINVNGEISADVIRADGCIKAKEIVGDQIYINTHIHRFFHSIFKLSQVDLIEATSIELHGVRAQSVNGKDIVIGPHCRIDSIDCSGTLFIDSTSLVGTVTGSYTVKN